MSVYEIIGLLSTAALLSPVVVILVKRLIKYRYYLVLFVYCLISSVYNLMIQDILPVSKSFARGWGLANNLLDVPLMMTFLLLLAKSPKQRQIMMIITAIYAVFEVVIISIYGITIDAITIIIGPGLALVMLFALSFFVHRVKIAITYQKAVGKAVIAAAIFFAYGCFSFIYVIYYILKMPQVADIFLLYYISAIIYSTTLTIGLVIEAKRIKKLQELQVTRKELMEFFGDEDSIVPKKELPDSWRFN